MINIIVGYCLSLIFFCLCIIFAAGDKKNISYLFAALTLGTLLYLAAVVMATITDICIFMTLIIILYMGV